MCRSEEIFCFPHSVGFVENRVNYPIVSTCSTNIRNTSKHIAFRKDTHALADSEIQFHRGIYHIAVDSYCVHSNKRQIELVVACFDFSFCS